jgi:hypothetical protein
MVFETSPISTIEAEALPGMCQIPGSVTSGSDTPAPGQRLSKSPKFP